MKKLIDNFPEEKNQLPFIELGLAHNKVVFSP